jgi:hypothetical protein
MATESTAIVNLLDLVKNQKKLDRDSADDLLFGGRVRFDPMAMPAPAHPVMLPQPFIHQPTHAIEQRTHQVARVASNLSPKKLALPVGLFVVAMVLLSVYLAKGDSKSAPKATIVQAPQPTVEVTMPAATPPPAPAPAPEAAAAAVVTPIDQAQPTVTEIEAPVAQPTVTEIQPTVPTVAEVQPTVPTVPTVADVQPIVEDEKPVAKKSSPKSKRKSKTRAAKRAKKETRVATADEPKPAKLEKLGGKGGLQISSSPAREVWIDGRNTKQMTPQKLTLSPGTHNITLFDKKTRNAKTFQVDIKANETLRVSKKY